MLNGKSKGKSGALVNVSALNGQSKGAASTPSSKGKQPLISVSALNAKGGKSGRLVNVAVGNGTGSKGKSAVNVSALNGSKNSSGDLLKVKLLNKPR